MCLKDIQCCLHIHTHCEWMHIIELLFLFLFCSYMIKSSTTVWSGWTVCWLSCTCQQVQRHGQACIDALQRQHFQLNYLPSADLLNCHATDRKTDSYSVSLSFISAAHLRGDFSSLPPWCTLPLRIIVAHPWTVYATVASYWVNWANSRRFEEKNKVQLWEDNRCTDCTRTEQI